MNMATLTKLHNFIWYGICENTETTNNDPIGECLPFDLNSGNNIEQVWLTDSIGNQTHWNYENSENDFSKLLCGNAYYIKLRTNEDGVLSQDIPHAVNGDHDASDFFYSPSECNQIG